VTSISRAEPYKQSEPLTGIVLFVAFVATVVAANWAVNRWGIVSVGFGLEAPAGVFFAGLAFGLRDALHEAGGRWWVLAAIAVGGVVSYVIEDAVTIPGGHVPLALASAIAFTVSELADLGVYSPLRERNWPIAVAASNVVGAVLDSALFLWLAFGSLDFLAGQVVAKSYMIALALPIVAYARRRRYDTSST
jgi:queuosine precursor transporter